MINLIAFFLSLSQAFAVSADPSFGMSAIERAKYFDQAVRSVVAVHASNHKRCTGTLVSPTMVLTSAHCFDQQPGEPAATFQILLLNNRSEVTQTIAIKNVNVHPLWLMGRRSIEDANARLNKIEAQVLRVIMSSGDDCPLNHTQFPAKKLIENVAMYNGHKFETPACAAAFAKIRTIAFKNKIYLQTGEGFLKETRAGDLAVAELSEPVRDGFHQPMTIDYDFTPSAMDTRLAFISGLGLVTSEKKFYQPVNPMSFGMTGFGGMVSDDLMEISGSAVICPGDSGGPTSYLKFGKMILAAVNAGTTGCNFRGNLSHAIILRAHADWIQSIIGEQAAGAN